jgi:DNA segregation ATPase FtsK/SpoIIIE, S-DNA-T family
MKKKGKTKKHPDARRVEILGMVIMAFGLLLFLGLVSYHPSDYPNSGSMGAYKNWISEWGAWASHYIFVYTIGYSSLIFPLMLFLFGWNLFLHRDFRSFLRLCIYLAAMGIFLSTALAMPEALSKEGSEFGYRLSGLFGGFVAEKLNQYFGAAGSIIILFTFFMVILVSATSWSMREAVLGFRDAAVLFFKKLGKSAVSGRRTDDDENSDEPEEDEADEDEDNGEDGEEDENGESGKETPAEAPRVIHTQPAIKPRIQFPSAPARPEPSGESALPQGVYQYPPLDLLDPPAPEEKKQDREVLERKAQFLEEKLKEFEIQGNVVGIMPGPVITRFEVKPAPGMKVSRFVGMQDDLALVLQAERIRVTPIPGKAVVGVEIPNDRPSLVSLRDVLESRVCQKSPSKLTIALGKTIEGQPFTADLTQLPHLLVAGATGSGKSVCLNTIISSILFRARPSEVKLVMIDPKKLELSLYKPLQHHHLVSQADIGETVITTVDNAVVALKSLEIEMERRYRVLAKSSVRNIEDFNRGIDDGKVRAEEGAEPLKKLPYIVLIIDELADLMVLGAREVEEPIARLAQMSRAVGIHLILATQRPSVDVITGVIKANFPARIAFQVAAKTDSRTILDRNGAEKLLGRGDMLFMQPRDSEPIRIHGAFISTEEVQRVVKFIEKQPREPDWMLPSFSARASGEKEGFRAEQDELFWEAAKLVVRHNQGSASLLQRRLRIGYARAGRLIDELEAAGILGPFDGSKARDVLMDEEDLDKLRDAMKNASNQGDIET